MQDIDEDVLQRKCDIGSDVHAAIKAYFEGEFYPLNETTRGYFQSFEKWCKASHVEMVECEKRYNDDVSKISGCIDLLATIGANQEAQLIDFKTSVSESKPHWSLQATFYHMLLLCNGKSYMRMPCLWVKLDKEGNMPKVFEYHIDSSMKTKAVSALNVYRMLTNM